MMAFKRILSIIFRLFSPKKDKKNKSEKEDIYPLY